MSDSNPFAFSGPFANNADHYENVTPDDLPPLPMPTEQEAAEMALEFDELRMEEFRIDDEPDHDDADDVAQYADEQSDEDYSDDDGMTDAEADADTLRMAGMGTDEDYGYEGDDF